MCQFLVVQLLQEACLPDEQCVMQKVVLGMALEVAQLDSFGVGGHNASACQQGPMNPRLGFADVVAFLTLHA